MFDPQRLSECPKVQSVFNLHTNDNVTFSSFNISPNTLAKTKQQTPPKNRPKPPKKMKGSFPNYQFSKVKLVTFREDKIQLSVAVASHATKPCHPETSQQPGVSHPPWTKFKTPQPAAIGVATIFWNRFKNTELQWIPILNFGWGKKSGKKSWFCGKKLLESNSFSRIFLSLIKSFFVWNRVLLVCWMLVLNKGPCYESDCYERGTQKIRTLKMSKITMYLQGGGGNSSAKNCC